MADVSLWMQVENFTVNQAAALWCGANPAKLSVSEAYWPSEIVAAKQMLTAAIIDKKLDANSATNALSMIGDHSKTLVSRDSLVIFARAKGLFPPFLFDTLAPFPEPEDFGERMDRLISGFSAKLESAVSPTPLTSVPEPPPTNRGGRPQEYDWDSFMLEIVRRANEPDGLPETQAQLVGEMLDWFQVTFGKEPAESAVKVRTSKIYRYLEDAKNLKR